MDGAYVEAELVGEAAGLVEQKDDHLEKKETEQYQFEHFHGIKNDHL